MKANGLSAVKLMFYKKQYLLELCGVFGCPEDVCDFLQEMVKEYPFLQLFIKKDIKQLKEETERRDRIAFEDYSNWLSSREEINSCKGGCYDCPHGNGEGGCTIPGYCLKEEEEVSFA